MEELTSRERYLQVQAKIKEDMNALKIESEPEEEEDDLSDNDVEEMVEIDKSMGDQKFTMTSEQYHHQKKVNDEKEAIESIKQIKIVGKHLTEKEAEKLKSAICSDSDDPVLRHLIKQKALRQKDYESQKQYVAELNAKIVYEIGEASRNLLKTQGAIENIDKQILDYADEHEL